MYQQVLGHCSTLSPTRVFLFAVLLAVAIEAFTLWLRFGAGLVTTRDTGFIGIVTFNIRIHHGYIGALLWLAGWTLFRDGPGLYNLILMIAWALILSDIFHHLVLWLVTGSPEFDLVYPDMPRTRQ